MKKISLAYLLMALFLAASPALADEAKINGGVAWLAANQQPDGSWGGEALNPASVFMSTQQALRTLADFGTEPARTQGLAWMASQDPSGTDALSRYIYALSGTGTDVAAQLADLAAAQNADGGWGADAGFASDILDTALALSAMAKAGYGLATAQENAKNFLTANINLDGGYGLVPGDDSEAYYTAQVVSALLDYKNYGDLSPADLTAAITSACAWLVSDRHLDGSWGNPSSVYETALAGYALAMSAHAFDYTATRAFIEDAYAAGSWNENSYETALAVRALSILSKPNLAVEAGGISFAPEIPISGENVTITAVVKNFGMGAVENVAVRFYEGDPDAGGIQIGADQVIAAIAGGGSANASVDKSWAATGAKEIYVRADPADAVAETSEVDNTAHKTLWVVVPAPDFTVAADQISFNPLNPVQNQTFAITAQVENQGRLDATNVTVRFYEGDPDAGGIQIGTDQIIASLAAGDSASVGVDHAFAGAGAHAIYVRADPDAAVAESREDNNTANAAVAITAVPDLRILGAGISFDPAAPGQLEKFELTVTVENIGAATAPTFEIGAYDGDPDNGGNLLALWTLSHLYAGDSLALKAYPVALSEARTYTIYARADPSNAVAETDEGNNTGQATVDIQPVPDLSILPADISGDPAFPKPGEDYVLSATVSNIGAADVVNALVRFYNGDPEGGGTQIGPDRVIPLLAGGESRVLTLTYQFPADGSYELFVLLDPDAGLFESDETNNRASKTQWVGEIFPWAWADAFAAAIDHYGRIYLMESNGDGTFAPARQVWRLWGAAARAITIEDYDNDGDLDIIAGAAEGADAYYHLLLNDGTNQFTHMGRVGALASASSYAMGMASGDFNNDGFADFAGNGNNTATGFFFGTANPLVFTADRRTLSGTGRGMDSADFNMDGNLDLIRASYNNGYIYLMLGNGDGTFAAEVKVGDTGSDPYGLVAADFDNDGNADFVGNSGSGGDTYIYYGNGDGTFVSGGYLPFLDQDRHGGFDAYDFNADGNVDVVSVDYNGRKGYFYPGNGDGTFGARTQILATTDDCMAVAAPPWKPFGAPYAIIAPAEQGIALGGTAALDGSGSKDSDDFGLIAAYAWTFGDGQGGVGADGSHAYGADEAADEGDYYPTLKVTDDDGYTGRAQARVRVAGAPPAADAGGPYDFGEDSAASGVYTLPFDGSGSSDAGGIVSYEWSFGNGWFEDFEDGTADGFVPAAGTWAVNGGVYRQADTTLTRTRNLAGDRNADDYTFEADVRCTEGTYEQVMLLFRAVDSVNLYELIFRGQTYNDCLFYRVVNGGSTSLKELDLPFELNLNQWYHLKVQCAGNRFLCWLDGNLIFDITDSTYPRGQVGISTYRTGAEFDNLRLTRTATGPTPTITSSPGVFTATVLVTDKAGQQSSDTTNVNVHPGAPPLAVPGGDVNLGEADGADGLFTVSFDGTGSSDDLRIISYHWNFGDGSSGTGPTPIHSYAPDSYPKTYTVTLTVTDEALQTHAATLQVSIDIGGDAGPTADPGGPYEVNEESVEAGIWTVYMDGSASADDNGIYTYDWDFGDGETSTTWYGKDRSSFFCAGTSLYGYDVTDAALRVIATQDGTTVKVINLASGAVTGQTTLNRFGEWTGGSPGDGIYFKVFADKPVVALMTDGSSHSSFIPSLDDGPVGHEFIFRLYTSSGFYVFAHEDTEVTFYYVNGTVAATSAIPAGGYWAPGLGGNMYRVKSSGRISMQTVGNNAYTAVPADNGDGAGRLFYCATSAGSTGAVAVFAYEDATIEVYNTDTGDLLYTQAVARGDTWWRNALGSLRMRIESTGDVSVWAGDTEGGTGIVNLGDDISYAGGRQGKEFLLHGLMNGFVLFAPYDNTSITVNGASQVLAADQYVAFAGGAAYSVTSSEPVIIQSLGFANGLNDEGSYLGGIGQVLHYYDATGVYNLNLTVTDNAGRTDSAGTTVTVGDSDPPVADPGGPYAVDEAEAAAGLWRVVLDAGGSTDDYGIYYIIWDIDDSDGVDFANPDYLVANPTHYYAEPGTYTATVRVIDQAIQVTDAKVTITVSPNEPPLADAGGPYVLGEEVAKRGQFLVTYNGTDSTDDFGIYRYDWVTGETWYRDFAGTTIDTDDWTVSGAGISQDEVISATGVSSWGQRYIFSKREFTREDGSEFSCRLYSVGNGDNRAMWGLKNNYWVYQYQQMPYAIYFYRTEVRIYEDGTYRGSFANISTDTWYELKIKLKARQGALYYIRKEGDADWTLVYDSNHATRATRFMVGMDVGYGNYRLDDVRADLRTSGASPTHAYSEAGSYSVTLKVTDHALQTDTDVTTLTLVKGDPPVADAGGPYTGEPDCPVRFNALGSTDDTAIARYEWDFGDGYTGEGAGATHFYRNPGDYTATLTVYDNMEQMDTAQAAVSIAAGLTPTALPGGPYFGGVGGPPVYFNGLNSTDDAGVVDYQWDLTLASDSFPGADIDSGKWMYAASDGGQVTVTAGELLVKGPDSAAWEKTWLVSRGRTVRQVGMSFSGRIKIPATGYCMVGWKDNTTRYRYNELVHAIYFKPDKTVHVYEDSYDRGNRGNYVSDQWYTFEIVLEQNGASYYLDGNLLYQASNSGERDLRPAVMAAQYSHYVDDLKVTTPLYGPRPYAIYPCAGTYPGTLTVFDGAGNSGSAGLIAQISGNLPPKVICVPWVATDPKFPHETYNGNTVTLKGVVHDANAATYQWDFGDGNQTVPAAVTDPYNLSAQHVYPDAPDGTPFVATLTVTDTDGASSFDTYNVVVKDKSLDVEVNAAIDDALWYMHLQQGRGGGNNDGRWTYSSYYASPTASVLQAFELHSHLESGDPSENPYVETVSRGMRYLMTLLHTRSIGVQTYGDPDTNGNGLGLDTSTGQYVYESGMVMMAIAASGTPLAIARSGDTGVMGRYYFDILTDMADSYFYGQREGSDTRGGWRYTWNYGSSDNSVSQWAAMGLESAEKLFGVHVPDWVKEQNEHWVEYSWNGTTWGYDGKGSVSNATIPAGLSQAAFVAIPSTSWYWINAESYIASEWDGKYVNSKNYYALYGLAKALRIAQPEAVTVMAQGTPWEIDWYMDETRGVARTVIDDQYRDSTAKNGSFKVEGDDVSRISEGPFRTAWAVVILSKTLFVKPPVADAGSDQVYGVDWELTLDGSGSYHTDPFRSIVLYEWDVDGDGVYDYSSAGPTAKHTYHDLGTYTVTLRVTDDNIPPITDTDTAVITIAVPPHAPNSRPGGPYSATAGVPVTFDGSASFDIDPTDFITEYEWEFEGGFPYDFAEAEGQSVTRVYMNPGTFVVGLRVWDNGVLSGGGAKLSNDAFTTVTVTANLAPEADAGGPYVTDEGQAVMLSGAGSRDPNGDPITFAWDLDNDGSYDDAATENVSHTFFADGIYTVGLRVSDSDETDTATATVTVNDLAPAPDFSFPAGILYQKAPVAFTDLSTSPVDAITAWHWDFGGLGTSALQNPSFTFVSPGDFSVSLMVTDSDGSERTATHLVTITPVPNKPPTADAGGPYSVDEGAPLTLDASGSSDPDNDPLAYSWDMDDNGAFGDAAGVSPQVSFPDDGAYTIAVRVSDGEDTDTDDALVTVNDLAPSAAFSFTPAVAELGSPTAFSDLSTSPQDAITAWAWDFGGQGASALGNPQFTFAGAGEHLVTLTVTDDDGSTDNVSHTVTVHKLTPAVSGDGLLEEGAAGNWDASASAVSAPFAVTGYEWDYNYDGQGFVPSGDTGAQASHTYPDDGAYTVAVRVTDSHGATAIAATAVNVTDRGPAAAFSFAPAVTELGALTAFTDLSTSPLDAIASWAWDFGGEGTSATQNPQFTFANAGEHTVTLTVTDDDGSTDSVAHTVTVHKLTPAVSGDGLLEEGSTGSWDASASTVSAPFTITGYEWDYNYDGQSFVPSGDTGAQASHAYTDDGVYTVAVRVTDSHGDTAIAAMGVNVTDLGPAADFSFAPAVCELGAPMAFSDLSASAPDAIAVWQWNFGGQGASAAQSPQFVFASAGAHSVTLTVTDDDGSADTVSKLVIVHSLTAAVAGDAALAEGSTGNWDASASTVSAPFTITGFEWDFTYDGATFTPSGATGAQASHAYPDNGAFSVAVRVSDSSGATQTASMNVVVANVAPTADAGNDINASVGAATPFAGSFTDPGTADTHTISWDFGDGGTATGSLTPTHVFAAPGQYTVTLTVTDDDGGVITDTLTVNAAVTNLPPVANAGGPYVVDEGQPLTLDASASTDPDGNPLVFDWDVNNDGVWGDSAAATCQGTWMQDGAYTARVKVSDGLAESFADAQVTVNDLAPTARFTFSPGDPTKEEEVQFTDTSTTPVDAIVAWAWSFGGKGNSNLKNPSFNFGEGGNYVVTLTVTDADGSTHTVQATVHVDECHDNEQGGGCFIRSIGR